MPVDTHTLIWLFPIAFMVHDFEEIILGEPWLRKNGAEIKALIRKRVPAFPAEQICAALDKSAAEFALAVSLIFPLTFISAFLAVEYQRYGFFLLGSGLFFLHAFMHVGQAIALRRYVPAVITSVLVIIPYGLVLFGRLIDAGIVDVPGLLVDSVLGAVLFVPFVLVVHKAGGYLYKQAVRLLI